MPSPLLKAGYFDDARISFLRIASIIPDNQLFKKIKYYKSNNIAFIILKTRKYVIFPPFYLAATSSEPFKMPR
jgi:hypothetical protein